MPGNGQSTIKLPIIAVVVMFVAALGSLWTWAYAEDKESDEKIVELQKGAALKNQAIAALADQLEQLNENMKQQEQKEAQDATNAMLRELLKQQGKDPDEVVEKAKGDKKKRGDEKPKPITENNDG